MKRLQCFNRCRIEMYFDDHPPPHLHVITNDDEAVVYLIETLEVSAGEDLREGGEALEWASQNILELGKKWRGIRRRRERNEREHNRSYHRSASHRWLHAASRLPTETVVRPWVSL